MRNEIERKNAKQACFVDADKAFDTIDLQFLLLEKCENYEFRGVARDILKGYLGERWQNMPAGSNLLKNKNKTGVPQGSVRRPLSFFFVRQ